MPPRQNDREQDPSDEDARTIEALIADPTSPVGIDAKKTHVLILQKLISIEKRLDRLERGAKS